MQFAIIQIAIICPSDAKLQITVVLYQMMDEAMEKAEE